MSKSSLNLPFFLTITHNGMPYRTVRLNKSQVDILDLLLFKQIKGIRFAKQPYDYSTSFALVDKEGETINYSYSYKGKRRERSRTMPLRINKGVWFKYRNLNRKIGLRKTDCSVVREFYREFQVFHGIVPTQETIRYFVEKVVLLKPFKHLPLLRTPTQIRQYSFIDDREITIYPVQRKTPSKRGYP